MLLISISWSLGKRYALLTYQRTNLRAFNLPKELTNRGGDYNKQNRFPKGHNSHQSIF